MEKKDFEKYLPAIKEVAKAWKSCSVEQKNFILNTITNFIKGEQEHDN